MVKINFLGTCSGTEPMPNMHHSSYVIECDGKRIVCSGDVRSPTELDRFTDGGCDLLIMETGHHKVSDVLDYAISKRVGALILTHHGREMLEQRDECEKKINKAADESGFSISIAYDGMSYCV